MIKDFVIPISKDELLQNKPGQYFVQNVYSTRLLPQVLDEARSALQTSGVNFILEHFDAFFSVLVHGKKIELPLTLRAFTRLQKAIEMLVADMENMSELGNEIEEEEEKVRLVNICKMLAYLFSSYILHIDNEFAKDAPDHYMGKRKKAPKSDMAEEWDCMKEKSLEHICRLLQTPLQKLWQPTIVEDSFVTLFTKICYKLLEQCTHSTQKSMRQTIFEILGISVKKYNHGISCVVRIIQLVQVNDVLPAHIAAGVVHMITKCGCTGLIKEIMKEIDQHEHSEIDSRNLSIFLETIAASNPNLIIPYLDDVMDYLDSEHYNMRNCTVCIIREIVQKALTGDNLTQEQKEQRDECLDNLEEHLLDNHAFVRSKVLQVWQCLCCEGAIPVSRQGKLLARTVLRLEDKSAIVRKQALQLIRALLQGNPFAAKLNKVEISKSLENEEAKLRKLQTQHVGRSARGDKERLELWNSSLPEIRNALKEIIKGAGENNQKQNDENEEEEENIDPDAMFEHIRQLMLKGKILRAVECLWKTCVKLKQSNDIENMTPEAKEEFLFLLLLKTFMESEDFNNTKEKPEEEKEKQEIAAAKQVVNYLKDCLVFATELEAAMPVVQKLLFSTTAGDAVEACTLLGAAYEFGVTGAADGIREALFQIFHRDPSVRNNLATVYRDIYLNRDAGKKSERQNALSCVKALIELVKGLQPGQSKALTELILTWYLNDDADVNSEVVRVLWEIFSMKSNPNPLESRAALILLTMMARAEDSIITGNFDVLIKIGLGPRAKTDLLLARDTCRAFCAVKHHKSADILKVPLRHPNDHEMFQKILTLLIENFTNVEEDGYISFATDAINAVYHLANQPDRLMKRYLLEICTRGKFVSDDNFENNNTVPLFLLSKFLYVVGHIAIRQMVHLDTSVYNELKRRDMTRSQKKNKNEKNNMRKSMTTPGSARQMIRNKEASIVDDNGEEAVEGAAEDADAEFIDDILENHVVTGEGLLAKFVPLVLEVCQHSDKYESEDVQAAGALALAKMMTVSSVFCEESLQLLMTILERSPHSKIRVTVLTGLSDLISRFPNLIEPWMKHIYARLRDTNTTVRRTCVRVLSNLIVSEMVRVRGQISELALCIVDKDPEIQQDARQFFKTLSQKGNALYNVMPDILSRLTDLDSDISESNFQEIVRHILGLLQKETQIDAIVNKICARFKLATSERQWRDFAYCLSLLQFSPKSVRCLIESLPQLKEKLHDKQVLKAIQSIVEQTKKKPNMKTIYVELEEKIEEILKGPTNESPTRECDDREIMPPPPPPPVPKSQRRTTLRKQRNSSDEKDIEDDNDIDSTPTTRPRELRGSRGPSKSSSSSSDSDSEVPVATPRKQAATTPASTSRQGRKKRISSTNASPTPLTKKNRHNTPRNRKI